jgi:hypothetical protein
MRGIAVRMASRGTGGQARGIGEIDMAASWSNGVGQLRGSAVQQLVALLGSGHMECRFDLVIGQQGLGGCAISKVGRVLEFTYANTFLASESSP